MIVVKPQTVARGALGVGTILTASNVPETDYPAWSAGTYGLDPTVSDVLQFFGIV